MRSRNPSTPLRSQGYRNRNSSPASFNFTFSSPSPEFHSPHLDPKAIIYPSGSAACGTLATMASICPFARADLPSFSTVLECKQPINYRFFRSLRTKPWHEPRGQFNSPSQSSPVICYPPPFKSPMTNFPHTPSSNRTFYMSAVADTPSTCASLSGQSNLSDSSRTHVTKVLNWKQRCTTDPWIGILPQATPSSGDRLVTSAFNQRHTVLFAPHSQISHEPIVQSS